MKTIKKITWRTWKPFKPNDFPCMICKDEIAEYSVNIKDKDSPLLMNLVLCGKCKDLPEDVLRDKVLGYEGRGER